jgi:hypothetical protein
MLALYLVAKHGTTTDIVVGGITRTRDLVIQGN